MTTYQRALPLLDDVNRFFWTSGADGRLRFLRCADCGAWLPTPAPICPDCFGSKLSPEPVSGHGVVESFTINRQVWMPGMPVGQVIVLVKLPESPRLRMMSNLVDVAPEDVAVGMPVRVHFEHDADVWLPLFEPEPACVAASAAVTA